MCFWHFAFDWFNRAALKPSIRVKTPGLFRLKLILERGNGVKPMGTDFPF